MGAENMRILERLLTMRSIDMHWVNHLTAIDNLRQGIGLHAYGQRDPLVMYRTDGAKMFQNLLDRIQRDVVHGIFQMSLASAPGGAKATGTMAAASGRQREAVAVGARKVGRNEPCPCGNGKKYKRCHGAGG